MNYAIQYTFFPGVILKHKISFFKDYSWFVIAVITGQNIFDTIGRYMARISAIKPRKSIYLALNFAR